MHKVSLNRHTARLGVGIRGSCKVVHKLIQQHLSIVDLHVFDWEIAQDVLVFSTCSHLLEETDFKGVLVVAESLLDIEDNFFAVAILELDICEEFDHDCM